jgi:hypothetical protein
MGPSGGQVGPQLNIGRGGGPKPPHGRTALKACLSAAGKQFLNGIASGPQAPSLRELLGLDSTLAAGGQITTAVILKAVGMEFAGGFVIATTGTTIVALGRAIVGSIIQGSRANQAYDAAQAACHAKYGN